MPLTNWHPNPGAGSDGWTPSYDKTKLHVGFEPQNKRYTIVNRTDSAQEVMQKMQLAHGEYVWRCYYWSDGARPANGWLLIGPDSGTWSRWGGYNGAETQKVVEMPFTVPAGYSGLTKLNIEVPAGKNKIIFVNSQLVATKTDYAALQGLNPPVTYFDGNTMPLNGGRRSNRPAPVHTVWVVAA